MSLFWCDHCNIPIYKQKCPLCGCEGHYFATDARPVFPEEILLLEILLDKRGQLKNKSVWHFKGNRYFVDGHKFEIILKDIIRDVDPKKVSQVFQRELSGIDYDAFDSMIERFAKANQERLNELEYKSFEFIDKVSKDYENRIKMVSFSGGKDSTVVSSLVRRALGDPKILHVFGNTTLEYPMTYEYVNRFRKNNRKTPFIVSKSSKDFKKLREIIGPPSRVMRWCCTVFKTGPISDVIDKFSGNKNILTFYGIRRSESLSRSKYEDITRSPKIAKQIVASPIIDWIDADIWLYLLTHQEDFNDAYRYGFTRVGCWCCPNNGEWPFFIARILMNNEAEEWRDFLINFAARIGKPDPIEYVDSGNWKARQGGNGMDVEYTEIKFEPCATDEYVKNYYLSRPISKQLYEFFKPFGDLNFDMGKKLLGEVYILDRKTKEPLLILQGREGQNHLRVVAVDHFNYRLLVTRIDCQIRKYQSCIGCSGCSAICKHKAIKIIGDEYFIDSKRCTGCMDCNAHFDRGCLVTKVTQTRRTS